ncbi:beta-propeller domain-containing protein [Glycomyces paridis]|uniref:Benzoate transporter n=1 Tax=Glycomyces paridis TaxID=2126555 RepID=A0A4S8P9P2_9ACTN|nr:beta-propeller domain-containing protein [Glycomyces paridis]THV26993.1 hypothetical protein E9998_16045 [Glycomyces paridis]
MKTRLLIALAAALGAGACTAPSGEFVPDVAQPPWVPVSAQLAAFDSCEDALEGIQDAAIAALGDWEPGGETRGGIEFAEEEAGAVADAEAPTAAGDQTSHSETNNAVAGVDEPDIVKTDGTYVYSVVNQVLRVVDTRSTEVVAERALDTYSWDHRLFLGDGELLLMYTQDVETDETYYSQFRIERLDPATLDVLDRFAMEGSMVDARLVGGEVRLAVSSQPQLEPVWNLMWDGHSDADDVAEALRDTEIEDWLPEFEVNGEAGDIDCADVAHPERFSGNSLSVLALPADGGWEGAEPHTVMADGETVHGTTESLYIAHYDYAWDETEPEAETELYRFAFEDGQPRLAGEAAVPGTLLNQYSLSEYDGHLRVATTENDTAWWGGCGPMTDCAWEIAPQDQEPSKSTVTVFAVGEDSLEQTGSVTDLGVDEQIYAVRFIGDTGYVVTFRQTDPLYTVDLTDPANPVVTGELKITGYSGYLHPVGDDRLLGVGQEATEDGMTTGLQVSLFDTGADEATVLDQYFMPNADSAVQWDPHAFLYWADTAIAVMPTTSWGENGYDYQSGALVLDVGDDTLTEAAWIEHDGGTDEESGYYQEVLRAIVIGDELWTLSTSGLQANGLGGDYIEAGSVAW